VTTETKYEKRRKYPRHKAPKGMFVGWKSVGQRMVSRAETVGMGGLFLHTPTPVAEGSVVELLFDLKTGEIRARAIVRHCNPGRGMGVQFMQMQPADRARLSQFLANYTVEGDSESLPSIRSRIASIKNSQAQAASDAPKTEDTVQFEREMNERLDLARKGTYYQLLSVAPDGTPPQIKKAFHDIARKFHPDYHMHRSEWMSPLKELMAAVTAAYKVLSDEDRRATYDSQLANSGAYQLRRTKTASQENIDLCFLRANECLRAQNFVGSIVWLRKCVDIAPDEAKYHALLARSLGTIPQYRNEAVEQFERAVQLDPWNLNVFVQFAELYEEMQMPSRARPLYAKVLEINPLHVKARERLIDLEASAKA
jgi:tetratricopeptide (TPR) repeat protein